MKKTKNILLAILGVLLITTSIMYRKYRRAQLKAEQQKVYREEAEKMLEFKRKRDSIERKSKFDSAQKKQLDEFNKNFDEVAEKRKKLEETIKKLQEEAKKTKE
ncbi:hypothetical protein [Leptobacterium sp. I13]|uniref:hypothetical protein n=1 Tax=Leptobacterium meishanense TaxID=3128904 RepID=UPI0030EDB92B